LAPLFQTETGYPVSGVRSGKEAVLDRRKRKVELFEQIRREYEHGTGTIK